MARPTSAAALRLAVAVAALGLAASCTAEHHGQSGDRLTANATVLSVVDGDTIVVRADSTDEKVRLIGLNTPETVDRSKPVMCFGKEASAHTKQLLPAGTGVHLVRDVEARDRYDRLLAYVYRSADGLFVNLDLVEGGFADQYPFPPNTEHTEAFRTAATSAKSAGAGAWSACESPFER